MLLLRDLVRRKVLVEHSVPDTAAVSVPAWVHPELSRGLCIRRWLQGS